eukprot:8186962-Ditylum_brightwellii.AAC.1
MQNYKKETSSTSETKTGDKGNTPEKGGKNHQQELKSYQKEILKEICQGKHTPKRRKYWQEQMGLDKCYFHCQLHASPDCNSIKNALQKAKDNSVTQGPAQQPEPPAATDTVNATPAA